jgi:ParB-like chromosome segregation protein Spo0J
MLVSVTAEVTSTVELAPGELGEALTLMRLCPAQAQQAMQLSLTRLGQLTPVQAYRTGASFEVFDGLKRLHAARELSWAKLRVEVHDLDTTGAKVRLLCCNAGAGLAELEEAWLVRSLYREDRLNQPQIAMLLSRHKSWVCRRLALAEGLSDELTASVRLGLVPARTAVELARLPRGNQDEVMGVITRRGLTTRQAAQLVQRLLAASHEQWPDLLEQASAPAPDPTPAPKGGAARRTPAEQLVADAWAMKRLASRLHARLLERSLVSLGDAANAVVAHELTELRSTLDALGKTLDTRLGERGAVDAV